MRAANIRISGKVQGVSFRAYAKQEADKLELSGSIRNEPDGTVYIQVEGEEEQIEKFIEWCRDGSEYAKVEKVKVARQPLRDMEGFRIERE
jgi:acylphosphatase